MADKVDLKEEGLVRSVLFVGDERGELTGVLCCANVKKLLMNNRLETRAINGC